MTREDHEKAFLATHSALKANFGNMDDLPYEFANMVANVYFRLFELSFESALPVSAEESGMRQAAYESMPKLVHEIRELYGKKQVPQWVIDHLITTLIDTFKYRIQNAENKMPIRRMIERKFRRDPDFPDLIRSLGLHK